MKNVYGVIMAGGSGTRFWPLSREAFPKQLLNIYGDKPLLKQTIDRINTFIPEDRIFIVTSKYHTAQIRYQVEEVEKVRFITEPLAKNTAPAIGLAAVYLSQINPEAIMCVLPADHVIKDEHKFVEAIHLASEVASKGYLITIGVKPTRPETGYGYIETGNEIEQLEKSGKGLGVFRVKQFIEKPDIERVNNFIREERYLWNSGIFMWKANVILEEISLYLPELFKALKDVEASIGKGEEETKISRAYSHIQPVSIDYGIMEKSERVTVIPVDFGWSDVGSWTALDEISERDVQGNVITGNVVDIDSRNSIIYASNRLVATVGLKDMVVVDTEDATLVCRKDRAQDVKKIVEELKRRGAEEHVIHRTVIRPWGSYTLLEKGDRYKIKRIVVNPGAKLSMQMHYHRSEHWVVVSGTAKVIKGDEEFFVNPNESTYIPMETKHRLENPGKIPLQIIEVQNGEYLEEDDIVRFDDDYGRE